MSAPRNVHGNLIPGTGVPDKRDECKCHRECTVLTHCCPAGTVPCTWPACLTEAETRELVDEIRRDMM